MYFLRRAYSKHESKIRWIASWRIVAGPPLRVKRPFSLSAAARYAAWIGNLGDEDRDANEGKP